MCFLVKAYQSLVGTYPQIASIIFQHAVHGVGRHQGGVGVPVVSV